MPEAVDAGGRRELQDIPGQPTFEIAVLHGRTRIVQDLLERGVDVHATVSYEHFGAEFEHLEKQNVHPYIWGTLLKHAQGRGYDEIAACLRDRGASLEP